MAKHKFASISLTVRDRAISSKFSTHRVCKECILAIFKKFSPPQKWRPFWFFKFLPKIEKQEFASIFLTVQDSDFVKIYDPTNAKRHEAEIIYIYTNKYLSIIDIFYKWNRVL